MKKLLLSSLLILSGYNLFADFPPARQTYLDLNQAPEHPFVASMGISMSQTSSSKNSIHPDFVAYQLQKLAQKSDDAKTFLSNPERIWYILNRLKTVSCKDCHKTLSPQQIHDDKTALEKFIANLANQREAEELTITQCPLCSAKNPTVELKNIPAFTDQHKEAFVQQVDFLGFKKQLGCKTQLPPYRISLEAVDVMKENSVELDPAKLQKQASWLQRLGNPFVFFHHYSNPQQIPNLFEEDWHHAWFANYCAQIVQTSPDLKYFCPINQPIAYSFRLARQNNLPPFFSKLSPSSLFKNVIKAHIAAYDAIKAINPQAEIFVSHQWKPMIPMHNNPLDPRYYLEKLVCSIASRMYNEAFVDELKKHNDKFDGLALSVYPPVKFNLWQPIGDNCSGKIDEKNSLECIMKMHEAFPDKKIFIVETGCNHPDPQVRKKFIDMTLSICLQARNLGANVCGVYFWGQVNDPDYYLEWNTPKGSSHFGFFEKLDPQNPIASVNDAGLYLKEIVQN